jgi:protein NRD1
VLTDADKKWLVTAEYGGTGGVEIQQGMVVEEPDIEIGAGPSSKGILSPIRLLFALANIIAAISRRGGRGHGDRGNFPSRGDRGDRGGGRHHESHAPRQRRPEYRQQPPPVETHYPDPVTVGPPPPVPTFGAPLPGLPYGFR